MKVNIPATFRIIDEARGVKALVELSRSTDPTYTVEDARRDWESFTTKERQTTIRVHSLLIQKENNDVHQG